MHFARIVDLILQFLMEENLTRQINTDWLQNHSPEQSPDIGKSFTTNNDNSVTNAEVLFTDF